MIEFKNTVGIVGNGFVGNAIYQNLKDHVPVSVYDINEKRSLNTLKEVLKSEFIFVCLPTPMKADGECDLSFVNNFFKDINSKNSLFIIKSTVPIGTTERLSKERTDLRIIHNPEFLTAINAVEDFKYSDRNIIGGKQNECLKLKNFYETIFPATPVSIVSSKESETIKYFCNCFLASKVALFNNLFEICQKFNMDYESIRQAVTADHRIGESHSKVPGPDGLMGFGGYCFPKDINAFINTLNENEIDASIFQSVWDYNKNLRDDL